MTSRIRIAALSAAGLCAFVALAFAVTAGAAAPRLVATVGPGKTIALTTAAGKRVTALKPGLYSVAIRDRSEDHDFHLRGPGLSKALSSVGYVGSRTVTLRLRAGTYTFVCRPHADDMRGSFRVR